MLLLAEIGDMARFRDKAGVVQLRRTGAAGAGVGGQGGARRHHPAGFALAALDHGGSGADGGAQFAGSEENILNAWRAGNISMWRGWRWRASCCAPCMLCCTTAWPLPKISLRRCKGNPSARCHPCSSRTTLRWSGGSPDIPYVPRARIEACPQRRNKLVPLWTGTPFS